jgi:type II secretory pathway component PulF
VRDLASVYRGLAAFHRAGAGWAEALAALPETDPAWALARTAVQSGSSLADALAPHVPGLDVALLRAGETSGRLEQALEDLAERHTLAHRRRGQRRAALAYPFLLAHVAALLLPLPDLVGRQYAAALLWALVPLVPVYGLLFLGRLAAGGTGPLPHRLPWTNTVEEHDAQALDALGALYDAGVPLLEALPLAREAGPRGRAAADFLRGEARVQAGQDLAGAWQALPRETTAGLVIAERTGSLGGELAAAAQRLAFDVEMRRKRTAARLGPLLVLVLGGIVALRVFGFYASYFRMAGMR